MALGGSGIGAVTYGASKGPERQPRAIGKHTQQLQTTEEVGLDDDVGIRKHIGGPGLRLDLGPGRDGNGVVIEAQHLRVDEGDVVAPEGLRCGCAPALNGREVVDVTEMVWVTLANEGMHLGKLRELVISRLIA